MAGVSVTWRWLRGRFRGRSAQLRLGLRVTVAAIASFLVAQLLSVPLAGLWVVLTAVIVTQMSLGGSLKATVEYFVGTLGGAVYGGAVATLFPTHDEVSFVAVLALAVAPLALLASVNPHFRVGPLTAVIVVLGTTVTHTNPIGSAFYRVLEVALGGAIGLVVSLLVLPARAQGLVIEAAAAMLDLLAQALPELFAGLTGPLDATQLRRLQDRIGAAVSRVGDVAAEAKREQLAFLAAGPDPGPLTRTLLRLRHDLVMIGRAAALPLPAPVQARLAPSRARVADAGADYLRASRSALAARRKPPALDAVDRAMAAYSDDVAALRREQSTRDLPVGAVERIFAVGFALEQLHLHFVDLARCLDEFAEPVAPGTGRRNVEPEQRPQ